MKYNQNIIENALNDYKNGMLLKDVIKKYDIPRTTLTRYFSKYGFYKNIPINKDLVKQAIDYYINNNISIKQCSEMFNTSIKSITNYLKENNISKKITNTHKIYNRNFFENVNTEEKAYWLGFLIADGGMSKNSYQLGFALKKEDTNHILKFIKSINGEENLLKYKKGIDKRNGKNFEMPYVSISSKEMYNDLIKYGLHPNKSSTVLFPKNISDELMRHYLRGCFDRDGCITGKDSYQISLISSVQFIEQFQEYISTKLGLTKVKPYISQCKDLTYMSLWKKKGNKQIKLFLDYLYKDANIFLDRKYEKYLQFCRFISTSQER